MSDQGEKTCPLCAEEMDLTDQQLKPCKCGYEICVWCWHHLIDMAEKDDTEGRCPACRNPYDKEKIVGMAANCGRMVAEVNMEKKMKSQKAKTKTSEGRKQLTSVRVIQRNLVYIVGLPLNLADEDLLPRREYFGQYGRVLKVSISRTAAGAIQHFPNNTCSVYITYSKEDEAVRCIQTVHGFVLDGRSLRACFGTTKYCHAWLRNVPCNNPDCLYLHEIGSQEDSFTKDEIISAYTRVQQITGAANNLQRRSGNLLPPPVEEYCSNSSASMGKPIVKNVSNNLATIVKGSPPNGSCGKSAALPAAASWGTRASNYHPSATSLECSNGPSKQKPVSLSSSLPSSSAVASATFISQLHTDAGNKLLRNDESRTVQAKDILERDSVKAYHTMALQTTVPETVVTSAGSSTITLSSQLPYPSTSIVNGGSISLQPSSDPNGNSSSSDPRKAIDAANRNIKNACSVMSSMSIDKQTGEHTGDTKPNCVLSNHLLMQSVGSGAQDLQHCYAELSREPKADTSVNVFSDSREKYDLRLDSKSRVVQDAYSEVQGNPFSIHDQRLNDSVVGSNTTLPCSSNVFNCSRDRLLQSSDASGFNPNAPTLDKKSIEGLSPYASDCPIISNRCPENPAGLDMTAEHCHVLLNEKRMGQMGRFDSEGANVRSGAAIDMGESSIISNILSMDFDAWDDSLTSPQSLAKMFGKTDEQHGSLKKSSSWKVQNSNQSRFSFARQEESKNLILDVQPTFNIGEMPRNVPYSQNFGEYGDPHSKKLGNCNAFPENGNAFTGNGSAFPSRYVEESDNLPSNHSVFSSSKFSVSRSQVSAPPGFSVPSRAPPPGFLSHERIEQAFDGASGNQLLETPSLLRNSFQVPENVNMGSNGDIEFMDPAILAVGKGRLPGGLNNPGLDVRSNVAQQFSAFENDARLRLLMQESLPTHQSLRFADIGDNFSPLNDSYGIPSRLMEQSQTSNLPPFSHMSLQQSRNGLISNGHWDGWSEIHNGNSLGMAELLRNETLGSNKMYTGYEDSKFRMPNSGDLYNRTFGM